MYTIRQLLGTTLGLTVSGVKHDVSGPATNPVEIPEVVNARQKLQELKDFAGDRTDPIILTSLLKSVHSAIDDVAKKTQAESKKIESDLATTIANESNPKTKEILEGLQKTRTKSEDAIIDRIQKATDAVRSTAATATSATRTEVGETIIVGAQAQAQALLSLLKVPENAAHKKIIEDLKDTNIQSLITIASNLSVNKSKIQEFVGEKGRKAENILIEELGYTSNGALGSTEIVAVQKFLELVIQGNGEDYTKLAQYAQSGLAVTVAEKDRSAVDKLSTLESVVAYLSDVPNARFRKSDVERIMKNLAKNPADFVSAMNRILGTKYTDIATVVGGLKSNPELKARFFDAINTNGANGAVGLDSFLRGKGADKAKESVEKLDGLIKEKVSQARSALNAKILLETDPAKKLELQKTLADFESKGETVITGEIRKVAEGAFVNIGRDANALGAGMTYEAFVKGLTVTLGAGIGDGGKLAPGIVLHYGIASGKVGESDTRTMEGNIGVGTSVLPAFIPFVDVGIRGVEKVTSFGMNGRGNIDSVGVQAQISKGGIVSLVFANERMNEIEQGRQKLTDLVGKIADKKGNEITESSLKGIIQEMKLTARDTEIATWTQKIQNVIRQNPGYDDLSKEARAVMLMGVVNAEAEKAAIQEANNDKDGRSFKGWSIGVGHILGVTFPIAGIMFKEGKISYNYPKDAPTNTATTVASPEKSKELKFSTDGYVVEQAGKSIRFTEKFAPANVEIDKSIGVYDSKTKTVTLTGIDATRVNIIPTLTSGKDKIESVKIEKKEVTVGNVESVRQAQGLDARLQNAIYTMNRNPEYKSFNDAILKISAQDYTGALALLESFAKQKGNGASITKEILQKLGDVKTNPALLAQLLTYTYGAEKVKTNNGVVNKKLYEGARSSTIRAEKALDSTRWNEANESTFKAIESHTPKQLSDIIPGQALSVSVFATPKDAQDRIDKLGGSIAVSEKISYNLTLRQKQALIEEHTKQIQIQVDALNKSVKQSGGKGNEVTEQDYKYMLASGEVPEALKKLGMSFAKKPVFFEARAMASGNVCMNKVEGIGYPTFTITRPGTDVTIAQPVPVVSQVDDPIGGQAVADEVISGLVVSGYRKEPEPGDTTTPPPPPEPGEDTPPPPVKPPEHKPPVKPPVTNTPTPVTTPGETPLVPITQPPGAPAPAPAAPAQPAPAPTPVVVTPPVGSPAPVIK